MLFILAQWKHILWVSKEPSHLKSHNIGFWLRNRSAPAVNCWVIIHCLEVSCKEDQITSEQREWFIFVQLTDKQWIITQQFTHWSWSISIRTHNKWQKHIRSLQLLPTFRHCTEELPPILRLSRILLHVIVTSFKHKNNVTLSNAMNDVIFQWRQLSHTLVVNYCSIYHSLLPLVLKARCVRMNNKGGNTEIYMLSYKIMLMIELQIILVRNCGRFF